MWRDYASMKRQAAQAAQGLAHACLRVERGSLAALTGFHVVQLLFCIATDPHLDVHQPRVAEVSQEISQLDVSPSSSVHDAVVLGHESAQRVPAVSSVHAQLEHACLVGKPLHAGRDWLVEEALLQWTGR